MASIERKLSKQFSYSTVGENPGGQNDEKYESSLMARLLRSIQGGANKLQKLPDRRVLIIYTGGTIGMVRSDMGYVPVKNHLEKLMKSHRTLCDQEATHWHGVKEGFLVTPKSIYGKHTFYKILEFDTLIDSANMNQENWLKILNAVEENYDKYDSFIIIHGTDTMAYSASFLAFALENLQKTIIFTGAQVPLIEVRNDAASNLLGALTIAGHFVIPEVSVYFRDVLYRGCRSTKLSSHELSAFDSPHYPPLATFGIDLEIHWSHISKFCTPGAKLSVQKTFSRNVAFLKLNPLISCETVRSVFQTPNIQAVIVESYGTGNLPKNRDDIIECIEQATARGIVVVSLSQCLKGYVNQTSQYEVTKRAEKAGIISAYDLTIESCATKLAYLLGKGVEVDEVKKLFQTNLRGELNTPETNDATIFCINQEDFILSMWNTIFDVTQSTQDLKQSLTPNLLCTASSYGYIDMLRNLHDCKADLNASDYDDRSSLHIAARQGHLEIVEFLLEKGCILNPQDKFGRCPLFEAIVHKQKKVTEILCLKGGAQLNTRNDVLVQTLLECVLDGDLEMIKDFFYCGLKKLDTFKNVDGRTIAHLAVSEKKLDILEFLKEETEYDFSQKDRWGRTPLDEAKFVADPPILKLFGLTP